MDWFENKFHSVDLFELYIVKDNVTAGETKNLLQDVDSAEANDSFSFDVSPAQLRLNFIRNLFSFLLIQWVLFATFAFTITLFIPTVLTNEHRHFWLQVCSFLSSFFFLVFSGKYRRSHPTSILLYGAFVICWSVFLASLCLKFYSFGKEDLLFHTIVTFIFTFAALTIYAFLSKEDFNFLYASLWAVFTALLISFVSNRLHLALGSHQRSRNVVTCFFISLFVNVYILFCVWTLAPKVTDNYPRDLSQPYYVMIAAVWIQGMVHFGVLFW